MTSRTEVEARIREMAALVDDEEEPFNLQEEMLRLRAAHELLERGHNIEAAAVFEHRGGAAADRFERREAHHRDHFLARQIGDGQRREPAGERRPIGRRQILVNAFGDDEREVRVDVGKAWHHDLAGARCYL